jgi:release factor glutamine methyltransferase
VLGTTDRRTATPSARNGPVDAESVAEQLRQAGCIAADDEAAALVRTAEGDADLLVSLVDRRCSGEPLAWLVGSVRFCEEKVSVRPGVYVPRWQSEPLALEGVRRLPPDGVAVDLCTGAGAIAVVLAHHRPSARVLATELDPAVAECARANGVEVFVGDLAAPLPRSVVGHVDVVTAVAPYVPTGALRLLPPDVLAHEPRLALDGGEDGLRLVLRAVADAAELLRPGGSILLELGGDQADLVQPVLDENGFRDVVRLTDDDGDLRGVCARRR